jgi:hypothetical protein
MVATVRWHVVLPGGATCHFFIGPFGHPKMTNQHATCQILGGTMLTC